MVPDAPRCSTVTDPAGVPVAEETFLRSLWEGEERVASFALPALRLWSPEDPALYSVRVEIETPAGSTALEERCGFRSFAFRKKGPFYLNGSRLPLRGTHRHEDHAGLGAAMPEDLIRREMAMMKAMGVNFIRLGHYQQSRIVLLSARGLFSERTVPRYPDTQSG